MLGLLKSGVGRIFSRNEKAIAHDTNNSASDLENMFVSFSGYGPAPWRDDPQEQVRHCRHWVYAAVRAIASRVSGTSLKFFQSGTPIPMGPEHPLPRLMRSVNPFDTSVSLWMKTVMFLELTGNAYWYVARNPFGAVVEIWVIPSQYMRVIPDRKKFISGYLFRNGTVEEKFTADEIIHLKYPSPESMFYGRGPLQAAASAVDTHEAIKEAERRSFERGVFPGLAIQTREKLSREVRERLETTLRRGFSGPDRAGRALILEQGLNVKPFTISPREMDFLESSRITRDEILAVFGVPAAVAGISEDVNRASAEAMMFTFAQNTIIPKLKLLEAQLTQDLCSKFDPTLEARFDDPSPSIREEDRSDMVARLQNNVTTPEEERLRLGLPALKDKEAEAGSMEQLHGTVRAVLGGQHRRVRAAIRKHGLPLSKSVKAVLDDPDELNRVAAPLVPAISSIISNRDSGGNTAKELAQRVAKRTVLSVRAGSASMAASGVEEALEEMSELYRRRIVPEAIEMLSAR